MDIKAYLISRFGSSAELARALHITPGAVSQWKHIPLNQIPFIIKAAEERGFNDISIALFYPQETSRFQQEQKR
jgi:hypothetical protein